MEAKPGKVTGWPRRAVQSQAGSDGYRRYKEDMINGRGRGQDEGAARLETVEKQQGWRRKKRPSTSFFKRRSEDVLVALKYNKREICCCDLD